VTPRIALVLVACAGVADAGVKKHVAAKLPSSRFTSPEEASTTPAWKYSHLTQDECEAELGVRQIEFTREPSPGVRAPVRVRGAIHGIVFHTDLPEAKRETSPWEIADCRLVLALDDFATILAEHDIVEVRHYSIYRPPGKSWPEDKIASRHAGALALDAARFIKSDGKFLDVLKDFHGGIGRKTCGEGAGPRPVTPEGTELREILCTAVDRRLFNVVLTPNYNKPHRNHFHLELTEGVTWFLVH
jgi:hypothetical protein